MSSLTVFHLAALMVVQAPADAAPRPISQLVHTTWTAKDGAPTEVLAFAQTADGYLWIGARSGLVRFDGVRFVPFSTPTGDTLPTGGVRRLRATRDGSLWIVSVSGLVSRLRDGRVTIFGEKDGIPRTFQLTESRGGALLAGTGKGIRRFADGKWIDVGREWAYSAETRALWFDREDVLWVQTPDRFVYLPAGAKRLVDPGTRLITSAQRGDFAQAKDGTIWFSEVGRSAHTVPRAGDPPSVSEVQVGAGCLLIDRNGSLWVGSFGDGLRRVLDPTALRGKKVAQFGPGAEQYSEKDGLLAGIVNALFEDREGNVWVATDRGIERFRESVFTPYATAGPVLPRFVFATRDTAIWSAAFNRLGIMRVGPRGRDSIPTLTFIDDAAEDRAGTLWFPQAELGVGWIKDRGMASASVVGARGAVYDAVTADSAGVIWVSERGYGLTRATPAALVRAESLPPLTRPLTVMKMFADRRGRVWMGHLGHVSMYDRERMHAFGPEQGVIAGPITGFLEDRAGNIWVSGDGGIARFEGDRFRSPASRKALLGRPVYGFAEDALGAWWLVTAGGVLRLPPGEMEIALADTGHALQYRSFGLLDGLPGMLSGSISGPQITRAADGRIWVATDSGIASVDPRNIGVNDAPPVHIEAVRVGGRELVLPVAAVGPRITDLEIDYTAPALANPQRIQFRYRLDDADSVWRDAGTRRRAYFTGLEPGSYTFRVSARDGEGPWGDAGAAWTFRVLPAWYQTLWFRGALLLIFAGLVAAGAVAVQRRRHFQAREKLKSEYEATIAERGRIAQDLHDTLLQGFTGLTLQLKAAELAVPANPAVAVETLASVQRLAWSSLREARERVWDMRETELGKEDLLTAFETCVQERTAGTGIEARVNTSGRPRRLAARIEDSAFRIGREAIMNAVRHSGGRRIEVNLYFEEHQLRLEVRDDGRGFVPDGIEQARRSGHFGVSGARDRAALMGGRVEILRRPEGGTIVSLELPLPAMGAQTNGPVL